MVFQLQNLQRVESNERMIMDDDVIIRNYQPKISR